MTQDSDKNPKKGPKKTGARKRTKKAEENFDLDDAFEKKIKAALEANLEQYARKKNLSQKQVTAITSFVEEHLSCFVLLGYTVGGDPVTIVNANTQKDSDSLGTALSKFLAKYSEPPPTLGLF